MTMMMHHNAVGSEGAVGSSLQLRNILVSLESLEKTDVDRLRGHFSKMNPGELRNKEKWLINLMSNLKATHAKVMSLVSAMGEPSSGPFLRHNQAWVFCARRCLAVGLVEAFGWIRVNLPEHYYASILTITEHAKKVNGSKLFQQCLGDMIRHMTHFFSDKSSLTILEDIDHAEHASTMPVSASEILFVQKMRAVYFVHEIIEGTEVASGVPELKTMVAAMAPFIIANNMATHVGWLYRHFPDIMDTVINQAISENRATVTTLYDDADDLLGDDVIDFEFADTDELEQCRIKLFEDRHRGFQNATLQGSREHARFAWPEHCRPDQIVNDFFIITPLAFQRANQHMLAAPMECLFFYYINGSPGFNGQDYLLWMRKIAECAADANVSYPIEFVRQNLPDLLVDELCAT